MFRVHAVGPYQSQGDGMMGSVNRTFILEQLAQAPSHENRAFVAALRLAVLSRPGRFTIWELSLFY